MAPPAVLERRLEVQQASSVSPAKPAAAKSTAEEALAAPAATATRSLLIIIHGKRVEDEQLREAIQQAKKEGHTIAVRATWEAGDVDRLVHEAVELHRLGGAHYHTLVAAGGDGTLNELVAAMLRHKAPPEIAAALLPLGTSNDFACATAISMDPAAALKVALDPSCVQSIDVATVNGHPFINVAVAGATGQVTHAEANSALKRLLGPVAIGFYVARKLFRGGIQPQQGVVIRYPKQPKTAGMLDAPNSSSSSGGGSVGAARSPGGAGAAAAAGAAGGGAGGSGDGSCHQLHGDLLMLACGNSCQMGRTFKVCPDARLDDGLLDFTMLFGHPKEQVSALVSDVFGSTSEDDEQPASSGITMVQAPWLEVTAPAPIPSNRDGESEPESKRLLFRALPGAIRMHLPDSRMLVKSEAAAAAESGVARGKGKGKVARPTKAQRPSKRQLKRLLQVVQPLGAEVRARARWAALGRKLLVAGAWVAVGAVFGWISAHRRRQRDDQDRAAAAASRKPAVKSRTGGRRGRR